MTDISVTYGSLGRYRCPGLIMVLVAIWIVWWAASAHANELVTGIPSQVVTGSPSQNPKRVWGMYSVQRPAATPTFPLSSLAV